MIAKFFVSCKGKYLSEITIKVLTIKLISTILKLFVFDYHQLKIEKKNIRKSLTFCCDQVSAITHISTFLIRQSLEICKDIRNCFD